MNRFSTTPSPGTSANQLFGRCFAGYQCWFRAGDDPDGSWGHWSHRYSPEEGNYHPEMYPDFSDFPVEAAKDVDLVLCEFTHFDPVQSQEIFRQIHPGKLVFNHVARRNLERVPEFSGKIDYPVVVANDGDDFEF